MTDDDKVTEGLEEGETSVVDLLGGLSTFIIEPGFSLVELGEEDLTLGLGGVVVEIAVVELDLVAHIVDVGLDVVLGLSGGEGEVVLGTHLELKGDELLEGNKVDTSVVLLLDDKLSATSLSLLLLLLRGLSGGLSLRGGGRGISLEEIGLDGVGVFDLEDTVLVEVHLDLNARGTDVHSTLDGLGHMSRDVEGANGKTIILGVGEGDIDAKSLGLLEGELLSTGNGAVDLVEGGGLLIFEFLAVGVVGESPRDLDGVRDDVLDGEITDKTLRAEHGALESGSVGNGLRLVEGVLDLTAKDLLASPVEARDAGVTSGLDRVELFDLETRLIEGTLDGGLDTLEKRGSELLELFSADHAADVDVVHDALDGDGSLAVDGEDVLGLLASLLETEQGLGV